MIFNELLGTMNESQVVTFYVAIESHFGAGINRRENACLRGCEKVRACIRWFVLVFCTFDRCFKIARLSNFESLWSIGVDTAGEGGGRGDRAAPGPD